MDTDDKRPESQERESETETERVTAAVVTVDETACVTPEKFARSKVALDGALEADVDDLIARENSASTTGDSPEQRGSTEKEEEEEKEKEKEGVEVKAREAIKSAGECRDQANVYFKGRHYTQACDSYNTAYYYLLPYLPLEADTEGKGVIEGKKGVEGESVQYFQTISTELTEESAVLCAAVLNNHALACIRLEMYGLAIQDSKKVLSLARLVPRAFLPDPAAVAKAHYRHGVASACLCDYKNAMSQFRSAAVLRPSDPEIRARLKSATTLLHQQQFAKAIRVDKGERLETRIKLIDFPDPLGYKGPVFPQPALPNQRASPTSIGSGKGTENNLGGEVESQQREGENYPGLTPEFFKSVISYLVESESNRLSQSFLISLALETMRRARRLPNVVPIKVEDNATVRLNVCGDVHGQFYDLMNIFNTFGFPTPDGKLKYLFNGDFVDRGSFSVEVIATLYLAKLIFPNSFFLTRGNHESRQMTRVYGFAGEMTQKASATVYELFCESFDTLPLAHTINDRVFVVHGGLSARPGVTLAEINKLNRITDEDVELMSDLLWADPQPLPGSSPSKRGVSTTFGPDVTENFLATNGLELVIRSHEMKERGYEEEHGGKVITVFSAPNYCDHVGNQGAVVIFNGKDLNDTSLPLKPVFKLFNAVPHPDVRAMAYSNPLLSM